MDEAAFAYREGVKDERERCAEIVQLARFGEIDSDFRVIIHFIEGGLTLEDIKKLGI